MRSWGLAVALVAVPAVAQAEPRPVEVGGFVGVDVLPSDVELGNSWAPDQVPGSAPTVGGRIAWWLAPRLTGGDTITLALGIEGEVHVAMSSTTGDPMAGRASYSSPVLGLGAHLIAALDTRTAVTPHLLLGGGGNAMFTSSPFARDDLDPVAYWGLGASWWIGDRLAVRVDLRQGLEAGRMDDVTSTFAAELGVSTTFGARAAATLPRLDDEHDLDLVDMPPHPGDDVVVAPPPAPDRDHDGLADASDRCPDAAEDKDGFEDDDGCPDLDNDADGFADAKDNCPNDPEILNGYEDTDGCPDSVYIAPTPPTPPALTALEGPVAAVVFDNGKARLKPAAKKALDDIVTTLRKYPSARVRIEGHAGKGVSEKLARRRADAVKWHMIDAGIEADRLDTASVPADGPKAAARIELHVSVKP